MTDTTPIGLRFPDNVRSAVVDFAMDHPECWNPRAVHDRCGMYASDFRLRLEEFDVQDVSIVSGVQYDDFFGFPVVAQGHIATLIGDQVFDWTYRQFDSEAPVPRVTPLNEWRVDWQEVVE